ncbi:hypothetical protein D9611_005530 [Ephemerocybe angulata]|uniref:Uncharacterized protein n=2 Tax=Ephemerocybe angulata TaxID=980116 RepID=A0A8H6HWP3_9AGAR|nr:hypothetical protein D9611_005530 [Tulosesus angulatus]KAF6754330.1 hypothetical protein DFP72DRAFT_990526 [Tulosesus angulatus]
MATSLSSLSASVTRILYLDGFPKELKTKDIQAAFSEFDGVNGGFKIKWRDDTSLLIVFNDASVAKRAYLHTIAYPPPSLASPSGDPVTIRPYDGPDAQSVIQAVNARSQHHANASRSHNGRAASISVIPGAQRSLSGGVNLNLQHRNSHATIPEHGVNGGREPSPTLPSLPSHPTLNALISSTLGESALTPSDPAILTTSLHDAAAGPRIGDPGKRMLGAALGVRHPALGSRSINGSPNGSPGSASPGPQVHGVDQAMRDVQRAMGGLVVAE